MSSTFEYIYRGGFRVSGIHVSFPVAMGPREADMRVSPDPKLKMPIELRKRGIVPVLQIWGEEHHNLGRCEPGEGVVDALELSNKMLDEKVYTYLEMITNYKLKTDVSNLYCPNPNNINDLREIMEKGALNATRTCAYIKKENTPAEDDLIVFGDPREHWVNLKKFQSTIMEPTEFPREDYYNSLLRAERAIFHNLHDDVKRIWMRAINPRIKKIEKMLKKGENPVDTFKEAIDDVNNCFFLGRLYENLLNDKGIRYHFAYVGSAHVIRICQLLQRLGFAPLDLPSATPPNRSCVLLRKNKIDLKSNISWTQLPTWKECHEVMEVAKIPKRRRT
jgi:hypothetical protein